MGRFISKKGVSKIIKNPSIIDVSNCFVSYGIPGTRKGVNPEKLQRLVFYAQALNFAIHKKPLFNEDFEAWVHGPMSPDIYYKYRKYRNKDIPKQDIKITERLLDNISIKAAWDMYGEYDVVYLQRKVVREIPFKVIRSKYDFWESSNEVIPKALINEYYSRKYNVSYKETS